MRVTMGLAGLLGLLVVVFIMLVMSAENASTVIPAGQRAEEQARRIAGYDPEGQPVSKSITLEPYGSGTKAASLIVRNIEPSGPMATYFGLKVGDQIVQVGPLAVEDGAEVAESEMTNAYRQRWSLVVVRNGEKIKLPMPASPAQQPAPSGAGVTNAPSPTPAPRQQPNSLRGSIYNQINAIQDSQATPTH